MTIVTILSSLPTSFTSYTSPQLVPLSMSLHHSTLTPSAHILTPTSHLHILPSHPHSTLTLTSCPHILTPPSHRPLILTLPSHHPLILTPPSPSPSTLTSSLQPHTSLHPDTLPSLQVEFLLLCEQVQFDVVLPFQTTTDLLEQGLVQLATSPSSATKHTQLKRRE